jgi:cytochrome c553
VLRSLFPRRPLQWFGVALALGLVGGAGAFATAASGVMNLSAIPPHPDGWAHLLHFASTRSFARHASAPATEEPLASQAMIMRGAAQYAEVCASCHGAPGYGQSPLALSMRPEPPPILDVATQFTDGELFNIVRDGVRYTAMPAWPVSNRPDEVWSMVAFLKAMPHMDGEAFRRLAYGNIEDATRRATLSASEPPAPPVPGAETTISAFLGSKRDRPYLPGDPQDPFTTPAATMLPRAGFGTTELAADPMATCVSCHGADGSGRAGGDFPNLTLQSPQYLYDALQAFATGQRQSGIMWPIAASLSEAQMRTLATKIGVGPPVKSPVLAADASRGAQQAAGERIAAAGIEESGGGEVKGASGVPAAAVERCTSCHMAGAYLAKVIPRIEGQNAAYLRMQLHAFRGQGRGDTGAYDPMRANSHDLDDSEISAVSAYYAGLPPIRKSL